MSESAPIKTADALRDSLRVEQLNNPLLHPAGPNDILAVFCAPEVQGAQLGTLLLVAKDAGYREFSFACVHDEETHRPILGSITRTHLTAANASLGSTAQRQVDRDREAAANVSFGHYATFDAIARRIAELRRVGRMAILDLSP